MTASPEQIELIVNAAHWDPFQVLGPHPEEKNGGVAVRAFFPNARTAEVVPLANGGQRFPMQRIHPAGLFEAHIPDRRESLRYRLHVTDRSGRAREVFDPYAFSPLLTDFDLHLIAEGTHYQKYEKLGAHVREVAGVKGVHFGV